MTKLIYLCLILLMAAVPSQGQESKLTVGAILPLSGAFAPFGDEIRRGIEYGLDGKLKVLFEDSQFDTKTALSAYRKLTSLNRIQFLISAGGETCSVINQEAQKDRILHIAVGCNAAPFVDPDSYNFRLDVNEQIAADKTARLLKMRGKKSVALVNIENRWGETVSKFTERAFEGNGLSVLQHVSFLPDNVSNLKTSLIKVAAAGPDALFIVAPAESFALVIKQLKELQIRAPIISTISVENPRFIELAGGNAEGIQYISVAPDARSREAFPGFFAKFPAGSTFAAWGHDAIKLIEIALQQQPPKDYLQKLRDFVGAFNAYTYNRSGELELKYEVREIKDGKFVSKFAI